MLTARIQMVHVAILVSAAPLLAGCRGNPIRLTLTMIGNAMDDAELKKLEPRLIGQSPEEADAVFGRRHDTLTDVNRDAKMLVYLAGQHTASSRYVVEVQEGKITALFKTEENLAGAADALQADILKAKIVGKAPEAIEREVDLGHPKLTVRSSRHRGLVRLYNARERIHFGNARYCVLYFDKQDRCRDVRLVGVTASTAPGEPK